MKRLLALFSLALLLTIGCKKHEPTHTIILLDISGSIYPEEVEREFNETLKIADSLQRGDDLTIIPITGNARNDTPGHILRLVAPYSRQPFNSDLVAFRKQADAEILLMKCWARLNSARHTDIIGAVSLAQQERNANETRLVIMSDFLEDDRETNFATDSALASVASASQCAKRVHATLLRAGGFPDVVLNRLRSKDAGNLSATRLRAIDTFWHDLLRAE